MQMNETISSFYNPSITTTLVVIFTMVAAVTAVGNIFVIIAIIKSKKMTRPLYILFINFNMSDLLLSVLVTPINIVTIISDGQFASDPVCFYVLYTAITTITCSATTLGFIALYRLAQICYPKVYNRIRKPVCVVFVIVIAWAPSPILCGIFGQGVHFSPYYLSCEFTGRHIYPVSMGLIYVPVCLSIFVSYIKIFNHTRNSRRKIASRHILDQLKEGVTFNRPSSTSTIHGSIFSHNPNSRRKNTTQHSLDQMRTEDAPNRAASTSTLGMGSNMGKAQKRVREKKHVRVFQTIAFIFLDVGLFYCLPALITSLRYIIEQKYAYASLMLVSFILKRIRPLASLVLYFLTNTELRDNVLVKLCRSKPSPFTKHSRRRKIRVEVVTAQPDGADQQNSNSKASSNLSVLSARPQDITSEAGSTYNSPSVSNVSHM